MNKQEAIETIKNIDTLNINDMIAGQQVDMVIKNQVLDLISQIDEPQKIVVPKHIADKIECCKDTEGYGLFHAMDYCYQYKDSAEWLECNQDIFARAWLFGYEIEQEQLYYVNIPNVYHGDFGYSAAYGNYSFYNKNDATAIRFELTEMEIKKYIEWAWEEGFAKPVDE